MLPIHIAIAPDSSDALDSAELARVSAAIQRQVTRDFTPRWNISATVDAFPRLDQVPLGYWPVILTRRVLADDEGFHLTVNREPFAVVEARSGWSITASHEILEMLVDPTGTRTILGPLPELGSWASESSTRVEYLVEICDPCQSAKLAYTVNDVLVSDFVTPEYFASGGGTSVSTYSVGGNITKPRSLASGGSMTWTDRTRGKIVHVRRDETGTYYPVEYEIDPNERRPLRARIHGLATRRAHLAQVSRSEQTRKATHGRHAAGSAMRERASMFLGELASLEDRGHMTYVPPSDADVLRKITGALEHRAALGPDLTTFLEQAKDELMAASTSAKKEDWALSVVRSMVRARPVILTARDVPGMAEYDHDDLGWGETLYEYEKCDKVDFPACPPSPGLPELVHVVSDDAVIAIAGDWGTHNEASARIGKQMLALRPTQTIHLGDVYYAGTEDEERQFVRDWPAGSAGSFALNSNHEMYSGGLAYFSVALQSDKFACQTYSYFALSSSRWLFIGLDSAYNATRLGKAPYDVGHLYENFDTDPQVNWLKRVLRSSYAKCPDQITNKKICVLTHHHALEPDGTETPLMGEMIEALGRAPDLWYWGHVHGAAAYAPRTKRKVELLGRLVGHGGVPYISDFSEANDDTAKITWAERSDGESAGGNGFVALRLNPDWIDEQFYGESGGPPLFSNRIASPKGEPIDGGSE